MPLTKDEADLITSHLQNALQTALSATRAVLLDLIPTPVPPEVNEAAHEAALDALEQNPPEPPLLAEVGANGENPQEA